MYKITIQPLNGVEKTIYYPASADYTLMDAILSLKVGSAGEFNFTVPMTNACYDDIAINAIVTVYEDNKEIWRGDIQDININFDKSLQVYALEDLAWLSDEAVDMVRITNQTYSQRFTNAIAQYNSGQVEKRQFTLGILTAVQGTDMCTWAPKWEENLLDCLREYIAKDGYVRIRRVYNGGVLIRYIDIVKLSDYGVQAEQRIEFGSNLLDFVKEIDNTNFLNVLYPYGAETDNELYGEQMERIAGTPIQNDTSIAAFGRRERTVVFETESLDTLNNLAGAYLSRYSQPSMKIRVKAVDLGNIELVNRLHVGDQVRVVAHTFGIDQWNYITKQELDLLNIANNQIELSDSVQVRTLTAQVIEQAEAIDDQQSASSILSLAKQNALAILEGTEGGIITFVLNESGQMIEQRILNNLDYDQATKAWRWNLGGLAYLHRTYPSDAWLVGIAITMDGQINADFITVGSLNADRIAGGTLLIGGSSYPNKAVLEIKDAANHTIGTWNKDGIEIRNSSGGTVFKVAVDGTMTINGYAKTSDLSAYATNAGLAGGTTIISGGCIRTGVIYDASYSKFSIDMNTGHINMWDANFAGNITSTSITSSAISGTTFTGGQINIGNNAFIVETNGSLRAANGRFEALYDGRIRALTLIVGDNSTQLVCNGNAIHSVSGGVDGPTQMNNYWSAGVLYHNTGLRMNMNSASVVITSQSVLVYSLLNANCKSVIGSNGGFYFSNGNTQCIESKYNPDGVTVLRIIGSSGTGYEYASIGSWPASSDIRTKENIESIDREKLKIFFGILDPATFNYIDDKSKTTRYGVIAQNMQAALEDAEMSDESIIIEKDDGILTVNQSEFHGLELAGIKYLYEMVQKQQEQIEALQNEIKILKGGE